MVDVAHATLFGHLVGSFQWDERYEVVRFEYDKSFVGFGLEQGNVHGFTGDAR